MAARAQWKGSLSFGLVSIPVMLMKASDDDRIAFNQLHDACGGRIRYQKVCGSCGVEVSQDEIARGFEVAKDDYIRITDEDLGSLPAATKKLVDVSRFIPATDVDALLYSGKAYYLQPEEAGLRGYALVLEAMKQTGTVGVGKIAFRESREHLALISAREDTLVLELAHWPEEVRSLSPAALPDVGSDELQMAVQLVENLTVDWNPADYRDVYREQLRDIIEAKTQGKQPVPATAPKVAPVKDFMAALQASVEATKKKGRRPAAKRTAAKRRAS
jgi:DNA end-binding protein Ku